MFSQQNMRKFLFKKYYFENGLVNLNTNDRYSFILQKENMITIVHIPILEH